MCKFLILAGLLVLLEAVQFVTCHCTCQGCPMYHYQYWQRKGRQNLLCNPGKNLNPTITVKNVQFTPHPDDIHIKIYIKTEYVYINRLVKVPDGQGILGF